MGLKKKITAFFTGVCLFVVSPATVLAGGVNPWAAAAGAITATLAYKQCLTEILHLGNNAWNQELTRRHDEAEQGISKSQYDKELVDGIMNRLINNSQYELSIRSLPFRWQVNNSKDFNACCYPTNYISVNSGLMTGLCRQPDEVAAVLAHEMTHGIELHSAYNYAKAMAQYYGLTFLNMAAGMAADPAAVAILADYSIAKNVTLPTEYAADEGGFYLAASAGFNPGGAAAAMARMDYIGRHPADFLQAASVDPYDHPDTDRREAKLSQMMTKYSCDHVSVKNGKEVWIDNTLLLTTTWTDLLFDNSAENAELVAGGLARAFHDYDTIAEWNFLQAENGRLHYLDDRPEFSLLKDFVERNHAEEKLWQAVNTAYKAESVTNARILQRLAEKERTDQWLKRREEALSAEKERIKELRMNSDMYADLGLIPLARIEIERYFAARTEEDTPAMYSVLGRVQTYEGDFEKGLRACNMAIELNGKDPFNYLNRADVYRAQGRPQEALADCAKAAELDAKNWIARKMAADIYDELGNIEEARKNYQAYKLLVPKADDIPTEYVENKKK